MAHGSWMRAVPPYPDPSGHSAHLGEQEEDEEEKAEEEEEGPAPRRVEPKRLNDAEEEQGLLPSHFARREARSANNFALSRRPQRGEEEDEEERQEE